MVKEYLEVWKSILKYKEYISRKSFFAFVCVNYFCFLIINGISEFSENQVLHNMIGYLLVLFVLSSILAGIKSMNAIKEGVDWQNTESLTPRMNGYDFLKLLLISIAIGLINFLLALTNDKNTSLNCAYILLIYCVCLIPLSFMIFSLGVIFFKKEVSNSTLLLYFILFLSLSLIIQIFILQFDS
jgi:uncharacterized membrane protein YhaH (DUF805 family)